MKFLFALILAIPVLAQAQTDNQTLMKELEKLEWQRGPTEGAIAGKAAIKVPQNYVFLDEKNTRRFLEINGNPPADGHFMFGPSNFSWFAIFSFNASGYIKDDEKIDPDILLQQLQETDAPSNDERRRLGMQALYTEGWQVKPHYDTETKRLEWGIRLRDDANKIQVNYTSRLLGREGVMSAILVSDPNDLEKDIREFKTALQKFSYNPGESYAEFREGDKIAEYGLAALVLGGAAAVATKKGFWAVIVGFLAAFWKVLVGVAIAAIASIGSLFKRKKE
jgi:uncharacterized membrane-anchored protein